MFGTRSTVETHLQCLAFWGDKFPRASPGFALGYLKTQLRCSRPWPTAGALPASFIPVQYRQLAQRSGSTELAEVLGEVGSRLCSENILKFSQRDPLEMSKLQARDAIPGNNPPPATRPGGGARCSKRGREKEDRR
jgi:hypothetical protein